MPRSFPCERLAFQSKSATRRRRFNGNGDDIESHTVVVIFPFSQSHHLGGFAHESLESMRKSLVLDRPPGWLLCLGFSGERQGGGSRGPADGRVVRGRLEH